MASAFTSGGCIPMQCWSSRLAVELELASLAGTEETPPKGGVLGVFSLAFVVLGLVGPVLSGPTLREEASRGWEWPPGHSQHSFIQ